MLAALALLLAVGAGFFFLEHEGKSKAELGRPFGENAVTTGQTPTDDANRGTAGRGDRGDVEMAARIRSMLKLRDGEIGMVSVPHGVFGTGEKENGPAIGKALERSEVGEFLKSSLAKPEAIHPAFQVGSGVSALDFHSHPLGLTASTELGDGDQLNLQWAIEQSDLRQSASVQLPKGSALIIQCGDSDVMLITGRDEAK